MIFYRFTLMIVNYGKKTNERCNYANIYYSRAHIRRMHGAFCVFLSSELQRRHNMHKTKEKPPSRNFVHDSGGMNISSVFVCIFTFQGALRVRLSCPRPPAEKADPRVKPRQAPLLSG